ncbi:hypothetical protein [Halomonas sp. KO116]|uniref:hypothetical protein n=1 Tax=Halomonas sp. KO116 TaxID=1504981 RepID=UPI0004E3D150|nr:hypothetical protein [Halomonas sp. KO116]AJY53138.1 hypothetical protein KO116_P200031 [Halomonas sp. KO116]
MSQSILLTAEQAQEILENLSDYHALLNDETIQEDVDRVCGFLHPEDIVVAESSLEPAVLVRVDWFDHPTFQNWANKARVSGLASWGHNSHSSEGYCDIFVTVCPALNGEGSDSDMPTPYWEALMVAVKHHVRPNATEQNIVVRIAPAI